MAIHRGKTLIFTEYAWNQMHYLTAGCDIELSALGYLRKGTDNVVEEFLVPKQVCSGTSTVMDSDDLLARQLALQAEKGIELSQWCVWWHSHVNMSAAPSGTDENNIENLASGKFLWSIITNKTASAAAIAHEKITTGFYLRLDLFDQKEHAKVSMHRLTLESPSVNYGILRGEREWAEWATKVQKEAIVRQSPVGKESWQHLSPAQAIGSGGGGNTRYFGEVGSGRWSGKGGNHDSRKGGNVLSFTPRTSLADDLADMLTQEGVLSENQSRDLRRLMGSSPGFTALIGSELC